MSATDTDSNFTQLKSSMSTAKSKLLTKSNVSAKPSGTVAAGKSVATFTKSVVPVEPVKAKSVHEVVEPDEQSVPLTIIYNTRGDVLEISIINCKPTIPQKLIKLIKFAVPFHKYLNKITIRKGGLSQGTIYEISKILPYSNITDLCLDGNYVRQGNYFILLDEITSLNILSLCRCSINDVVCEDIVKRLQPGRSGDQLQSLSLSTNFIGDIGASKFGHLLRSNRNLLHLNLADNVITNEGAAAILGSLREFELNESEVLERKNKKMAFEKEKVKAFEKILSDQTSSRRVTVTTPRRRKLLTLGKKERNVSMQKIPNVNELAYLKAGQLVGGFKDAFDDKNTVIKNNKVYCNGNIRLCYLNLGFNDLDERILKVIRQVLTHQATLSKRSYSGLLKLVIEGNLFARYNDDLLAIDVLLMEVLRPMSQGANPVRAVRSKHVTSFDVKDLKKP